VVAIVLFVSLPALFAQTIRQEGNVSLPAGVFVGPPPGRVNFSAVLSRNAGFLATNFNDNVVRVWALPSGQLVHALDIKADPATKLHLSDDGRLLAIAAKSGTIKVWDIASWEVRQEFTVSSPARVLAIAPNNQLLAIATDHDEQIWELPTQKRLAVLHTPFDCYCLMFLAFSPDSAMLASADGDTAIRIYDARTGTLRSTASDLLLESLALGFSSDSKSLFVGGGDQTISVIDPLTGKLRDTLPKQSGTLRGLVASGDGKQIAATYNLPKRFDDASISVVLLWDLGTRAVRARFEQPGMAVLGGAFAHGRLFLVGGPATKSAFGRCNNSTLREDSQN
jgi:WD40 repeat protein